jgi:hypothetical protein
MKRSKSDYLCFILILLPFLPLTLFAQDYHAIQGSSFAGSIGVANNPASIVNTPFPWDINVFSFQFTNTTNAVTLLDYSLLHSSRHTPYYYDQGQYSRYAGITANLHLLNARFAIGRKRSIAFGLDLQQYARLKTSTYNFLDTVRNVNSFFSVNPAQTIYNASLVSCGWLDLSITYSQTLIDYGKNRLNAGVTLKAMRGISGAYIQLQNASTQPAVSAGGQPYYLLTGGSLQYGYSYNYDYRKEAGQDNLQDMINFLSRSAGSFAADLGAEYLIRDENPPDFNKPDPYFLYEWKIGVSLLDIGFNQFKYGSESRLATDVKNNISSYDLQEKFRTFHDQKVINDSMSTIVNNFAALQGMFTIMNPTRLVINVDRALPNHFFVNGELSVNLSPYLHGSYQYVQELNLLTITPRWEAKKLGVYLPVQYTAEGRLWIGAAFKAGPLLFGVHNLGTVFESDKMQNGGGYVAIIIRPGNKMTRIKTDKRLNCPSL